MGGKLTPHNDNNPHPGPPPKGEGEEEHRENRVKSVPVGSPPVTARVRRGCASNPLSLSTPDKPNDLVESVLKPIAKIAQGYESDLFTMKNGRVDTGFVVSEGADVVLIRE